MNGRGTLVIYGDVRRKGSSKPVVGRQVILRRGGSIIETVKTNQVGRYHFTEMFWPRGEGQDLKVEVQVSGHTVKVEDFDPILGIARQNFEVPDNL